ncbi:MAG TPA: hypothetical protein VGG33_00205, partial [Polyangia bacterium]
VGPFKIDFLRDPRAGTLLALEINARYTLWHHLGAAHGVNLPQIAHAYQAHGGRPEGARRSDPVPAMRWMNFYRELHAFRQTRPVSVARWLASLFAQPNLHEIFSWRDPVPFAAHLGRGLRRRWQRWRGLDAAPPGSGQTASKNVRSPWRSMG